MSTYIKAAFVFLIWAFLALSFHYFLSIKQLETCSLASLNSLQVEKPILHPHLYVLAENDTILRSNSGFVIRLNDSVVTKNSETNTILAAVEKLVKTNYENQLTITGIYSEDEINSKLVANMGISRANFLKHHLIKMGISTQQIKTKSLGLNFGFEPDSTASNGIKLKISKRPQRVIDSIEANLLTKVISLDFANDNWKTNPELLVYTNYLQHYFAKKPLKTIILRGHTAVYGSAKNDLDLGLKNAIAFKLYLMENNIGNANSIQTYTKGHYSLLYPNNTDKNYLLNNRIEIRIK